MRVPLGQLRSLRLWLQSTSLLAVVAGYSVLLLINQHVAAWQRTESYRRTLDQVLLVLARQTTGKAPGDQGVVDGLPPGVRIRLLPSSGNRPVSMVLEDRGPSQWMVGVEPLPQADGGSLRLQVEQNVTASVAQERISFWLLVAAAGISSLITGGLLRMVLHRGLVQPLEALSRDITAMAAPPRADDRIELAHHPQELQTIARAFNALQERLMESWERQRRFVDGAAHELRTPITLISGYSESLLRHGAIHGTPAQPRIRLIHGEAERMRSLVSDLLDLARRDSGRLHLHSTRLAAEQALLELFERMESKADGRLRLGLPGGGRGDSPLVWADSDRLQQCLTTLTDNALLYSQGTVELRWSRQGERAVVLHVSDQGPGVGAEERDRIFERFVRGTAGLGSNHRGSGIGLSITKLLMEAMGGSVTVAANAEGGADFQLWLPELRTFDRPA